jgi:hypothetical protein
MGRRTNGVKNGAADDGCVCHCNAVSVLADASFKPCCDSAKYVRD